ncbi:hypothetical protein Tco_1402920 [Tanacetum coccineum]
MNEDYYEQNSCYDPNSFGFDQFQTPQYTINHPILNAQNEFLNSQNKLMEQMTSICDMVGQIMQKKEEERRIAEDQAAKDRNWKIPICYDDDEDYTIAITPVLLTEEPVDSLIMEDEHLDTILATESDEVIKSSVEELVPIPSESEGISDGVCDVPLCDNPTPLKAFKDHSEILSDYSTSSDDDSYENIEYVEASPLNLDIVSLEEVNDEDQEEKEFDLEDIFQIQDVILREKLLNISRLVTNIESLKNNPTPDYVFKSPSSFHIPVVDSDSFFEKSDTSLSHLDNSLPEFETFNDHTEEARSGSTTSHANNSLPEYDSFFLRLSPIREDVEFCSDFELDTGVVTNKVVKGISEHYVLMPNILPTLPTFDPDLDFTPSHDSLGSRNTIFDPGIFIEVKSERLLPRDEFSISFIRDPLSPVNDTLLPFSSDNEDKVFNPGILIFPLLSHQGEIISIFSKSPMMISGGNNPHLDVPSGYHQKDRKPSQNDKTEHGMEKTVQNQGQSPKMTKSESILKNQQSNRSRN